MNLISPEEHYAEVVTLLMPHSTLREKEEAVCDLLRQDGNYPPDHD